MKRGTACLFLTLLVLAMVVIFRGDDRPSLYVFTWGEFIDPEVITTFEERYQCWVEVDVYDSNEAMYAKLKAGASGYDVVFPSSYFVPVMSDQDMLQPIDRSLLPNAKGLDLQVLANAVKESEWSVPYMISFAVIAYHSDRLPNAEPSWNLFGDTRVQGRASMLNDPRESLGAALRFHGYSVNSKDPNEISLAADQVIKWRKNLSKFDSEQFKYGLASSEQLLVHGYSGALLDVSLQNPRIKLIIPKEGTTISCDTMAIPKQAQNIPLAHAFINHLLDPEMSAKDMLFVLELSPIPTALDKLPESLRTHPVFQPSVEDLQESELLEDIGPSIRLYHQAWDRVKSSS